jgi:hypothetical protein
MDTTRWDLVVPWRHGDWKGIAEEATDKQEHIAHHTGYGWRGARGGSGRGGAASLPPPAYAAHGDAGHALRHRRVPRPHAVVRLGHWRWLPLVVTGCYRNCPVEP